MKLFVVTKSGEEIAITGVDESALSDVVSAIQKNRRRWLKRLRPYVVAVSADYGIVSLVVEEIAAVFLYKGKEE